HPFQICRPTAKFLHRICVPVRRHRYKVALIAHIHTARIGMNNRQTRILARQTARQIPTLLPIHPTTAQALESRLLPLAHTLPLFPISTPPRLTPARGAARFAKTRSLTNGAVPPLLQGRPATNQCIAAAEVMLFCGHWAPIPYRP